VQIFEAMQFTFKSASWYSEEACFQSLLLLFLKRILKLLDWEEGYKYPTYWVNASILSHWLNPVIPCEQTERYLSEKTE